VRAQIKDADAVVVPAVLGLKSSAHAALAEAIGRPVVEALLPPPSVPGMRLNQALTGLATSLGVRIIMGSKVVGFETSDRQVTSVTLRQAGRDQPYPADSFVYAPGGFESGALAVDSYGHVTETLFGLPLAGLGDDLTTPDDWTDQRLFAVGVPVDESMHPVGAPFDNLYVAGGVIAGAIRWRELSGDGIAVASAVRAVDAILGSAPKKGADRG